MSESISLLLCIRTRNLKTYKLILTIVVCVTSIGSMYVNFFMYVNIRLKKQNQKSSQILEDNSNPALSEKTKRIEGTNKKNLLLPIFYKYIRSRRYDHKTTK